MPRMTQLERGEAVPNAELTARTNVEKRTEQTRRKNKGEPGKKEIDRYRRGRKRGERVKGGSGTREVNEETVCGGRYSLGIGEINGG